MNRIIISCLAIALLAARAHALTIQPTGALSDGVPTIAYDATSNLPLAISLEILNESDLPAELVFWRIEFYIEPRDGSIGSLDIDRAEAPTENSLFPLASPRTFDTLPAPTAVVEDFDVMLGQTLGSGASGGIMQLLAIAEPNSSGIFDLEMNLDATHPDRGSFWSPPSQLATRQPFDNPAVPGSSSRARIVTVQVSGVPEPWGFTLLVEGVCILLLATKRQSLGRGRTSEFSFRSMLASADSQGGRKTGL